MRSRLASPTGRRSWRVAALALAFILLWPQAAYAERPPQSRERADLVVTGQVVGIKTFKRHSWYDYHLITLKVADVVKGNAKRGDMVRVSVFKLARTPPRGWVGASGHGDPPQKGAKITAYLNAPDERGHREGIYKNWFDLVTQEKK